MKSSQRLLALVLAVCLLPVASFGLSADDVLKAEKILKVILELNAKYPAASGTLKVPAPAPDKSGKFFLPYKADGTTTEWAEKFVKAQVGAAVGAKAGEEAAKGVASAVPGGFLVSGLAKKKGKQVGAVAAVGGPEFIKTSSDVSFSNLDDYAVYLHAKHSGSGNFSQALATAIAIYPDLEAIYPKAVKAAYERADAEAKAAAKAAKVAEAAKAEATK